MEDKSHITQENILNIYNYESIFIFPYPNSSLYLGSDYEKLTKGYESKYYSENDSGCRKNNHIMSTQSPLSSVFGPLGWWQLAPSPLSLGNLSENQGLLNTYTRKDIIETMGNISTQNLIIIDRPFNGLMKFKAKVSDQLLKNCTYCEKKLWQTPAEYRELIIRKTLDTINDIRYLYIYDDVEYGHLYKEIISDINQTIVNKVVVIFVPVPKVKYTLPVKAEIEILKTTIQDFNRKITDEVSKFNSVAIYKRIFATGFMLSKASMEKLTNNFMFVKSKMVNKINEEQLSGNETIERKIGITNELILVAPYGLGKRFEQLGGEGNLISLKTESYYWDQENNFLLVKFKPYGNSYERVKHYLKNDREKNLILILYYNASHTKFEKLFRSGNFFDHKVDWVKSISDFVVTAYATQRWVLTFRNSGAVSVPTDIDTNKSFLNAKSFQNDCVINSQIVANENKKNNMKNRFVSEETETNDRIESKKKMKPNLSTTDLQKNCIQNSDVNGNYMRSQTIASLPEKPESITQKQQYEMLDDLVQVKFGTNANSNPNYELDY